MVHPANFMKSEAQPKRPLRSQDGPAPRDKLLSVKQAAELLSCSEAAIRKWIQQGRLPALKVGRLTRLRLRDLEGVMTKGLLQT